MKDNFLEDDFIKQILSESDTEQEVPFDMGENIMRKINFNQQKRNYPYKYTCIIFSLSTIISLIAIIYMYKSIIRSFLLPIIKADIITNYYNTIFIEAIEQTSTFTYILLSSVALLLLIDYLIKKLIIKKTNKC